jgi:hypothetical protein
MVVMVHLPPVGTELLELRILEVVVAVAVDKTLWVMVMVQLEVLA